MINFYKRKLGLSTVFLMSSLALVACGDNDSTNDVTQNSGDDTVINDNTPIENDGMKTVSGKLVAFDGKTPINNALVYVVEDPNSASATLSTVSTKGKLQAYSLNYSASSENALDCGVAPANSIASTCTNADGSYELELPNDEDTVVFKFEKGLFTAEQEVSLASVQNDEILTVSNTTLESTPKMVVIEGYYDSIENILSKSGLTGSENSDGDFELWSSADGLFADYDSNGKADIFNYELVFFNCGQDESWLNDDAKRQTLKDYVASGGRIYVSDQAYDIVEQTFPEYIDFYGSDDTPVNQPEMVGQAERGTGNITIQSTVKPDLKAWLQEVSCGTEACISSDDTVTIHGFLSGWALMDAVSNDKDVDVYVSGLDGNDVMRPLTAAFNYNLGRVTFTSYHNEESESCANEIEQEAKCVPTTGEGAVTFDPQQRILQYLVFEL